MTGRGFECLTMGFHEDRIWCAASRDAGIAQGETMDWHIQAETVLFQARAGGYATYRIPGIVVTARGTLVVYCEARASNRGDWGTIDIWLRRSPDGGQSWSPPELLPRLPEPVAANPAALAQHLTPAEQQTYNNPVAIAGISGDVHFLHCSQYARCYYRRSSDEGASWSEPIDVTAAFEVFRPEYDWRVLATGPGHGIQLRGGRLVVPVWLSTGTGGHGHRPSCVSTIYSDDEGRTWLRGDIVAHNMPHAPNPSESAIVQLVDGRVMLNIRNESLRHRRLTSISPDGATNWTEPCFDDALFEPVCAASLLCAPAPTGFTQDMLLFANPDSRGSPRVAPGRVSLPRENLTLRASLDCGGIWYVVKRLETGISGYSDLAAASNGTVFCFYERGGVDGDPFDVGSLTLATITPSWRAGEN